MTRKSLTQALNWAANAVVLVPFVYRMQFIY